MNHHETSIEIYQDERGREPFTDGKTIKGTGNMSKQTRKFRKFEESLQERLRDPEYVRIFLDVALEEYEKDGDREAFLLALRDVVEAQGGIGKLAKETNLNRQNLYKALSEEGNPRLETVDAILHTLGFRLSIVPLLEIGSIEIGGMR